MFIFEDDSNVCLSGGALGADLLWGFHAGKNGHQVFHFSFASHKTDVPADELVLLSDEQLLVADPFLEQANKTLGRHLPYQKPWIMNLLRRDYYQVAYSSSVYAVAEIEKKGTVKGGTGWAVQMFLDRHEQKPCEVYLFDQKVGLWLQWTGQWTPCDVPPPKGIWAGIGSRDLKDNGKTAIRSLLPVK